MATIRRRPNGTYEIKVSCGYGVDGKQRNQYKSYKPEPGMTKRQIEKEMQRQAILFEEDCKRGQITAAVKFETFAEQWFEEYAKVNLRPTSYARMKQLTKRVYPAIGHKRLDKITARDIQKFITDMLTNGRNLNNGKPLSRKTAVHHLSFISDVFSYAVRMGMLCDNPCRRVFVPKQEQEEKQIYTIEQVKILYENLKSEPMKYQAYLLLSIYSGYRRSEMLGLEWKDIDFEHDLIHVRRTSQYTSEKGIYTDTTKTRKSKRVSKMPASIMNLLRQFKADQNEEARRLGTKWEDYDRLFTKWNGARMNPQTPFEWLKGYCERIGIPFRNIHSLRHLHASLLIFEGVDVVAVSEDMGHSVVGTTLNLYSHMFQEAKARNCDAISNALSFTNEANTEEEKPAKDSYEDIYVNEDEQEEEQLGQVFGT
ncbi:MAG: tyrosine recombinase XerC [Ruminococcus bicirculans (ex Wegman et al. 2014)]|uniref:site-specific integrase n=1 Tax=Ruminococcus bicirculans (ex Wegman et al. 2014) TaxID=1160721 RepID=UPI0039A2CE35